MNAYNMLEIELCPKDGENTIVRWRGQIVGGIKHVMIAQSYGARPMITLVPYHALEIDPAYRALLDEMAEEGILIGDRHGKTGNA